MNFRFAVAKKKNGFIVHDHIIPEEEKEKNTGQNYRSPKSQL